METPLFTNNLVQICSGAYKESRDIWHFEHPSVSAEADASVTRGCPRNLPRQESRLFIFTLVILYRRIPTTAIYRWLIRRLSGAVLLLAK